MLRARPTRCPTCSGALSRWGDCTRCFQHPGGPTARLIAQRMLSHRPSWFRNLLRRPAWLGDALDAPGPSPTWEPGPECRVRGRVRVLIPAGPGDVAASRWGGGRFVVVGEGPPALVDDDALELFGGTSDVCDGDRVEVVGPARLESRDDLVSVVGVQEGSSYRAGGSVLVYDAPPGSWVRVRRL